MNVGGVGRKFECPIGLTVDAHKTCLILSQILLRDAVKVESTESCCLLIGQKISRPLRRQQDPQDSTFWNLIIRYFSPADISQLSAEPSHYKGYNDMMQGRLLTYLPAG